ncbi:unnamed protein product [Owenia fusiformis]|uniref:adenylate cyclase n=1 Tax=Owenia fusiformis TaxID=6347 RepID=A0A8S4N3I9_OWEFU|nr:unnamed protein product [Owenia fusiformis]
MGGGKTMLEMNKSRRSIRSKSQSQASLIKVKGLEGEDNGTLEKGRRKSENSQSTVQVEIDQSGLQRLLPSSLRHRFADQQLESLYRAYYCRQKNSAVLVLIILSLFFCVTSIILYCIAFTEKKIPPIAILSVCVVINIVMFILLKFRLISDKLFMYTPFIPWILFATEIYVVIGLESEPIVPSLAVGWQCFLAYLSYVMLPLPLRWCMLLSSLSCLVHTIVVIVICILNYPNVYQIGNAVGANIFLFLCANILGIISYFFNDINQRKAFLETKASLNVKIIIEEGSKEQERLLLSVLPKHVADEMVQDMGDVLVADGQFRKIYMSRHENVSILYADIVGFTAISSKCTAGELVKILNELFARFDKLAEKYHQLRIKILGDCYYCISGAPEPRSDHAVLSVHMGLAMVDAISDVRAQTKTDVNMRVGIHTGAVLGGVVGQKQWQFDVLGKDVSLANKMESGGLAGRVHISHSTTKFMHGEFELEPGDGDQREEAIRMAGMKTYLIKSVIKPYPEGTLDEIYVGGMIFDQDDDDNNEQNKEENLNKLLYEAIVEKEATQDIGKRINFITMHYHDTNMEELFDRNRQKFSSVAILGTCVVLVCCFFSYVCIAPKSLFSILTFIIGALLLTVFTVFPFAASSPKRFVGCAVSFSQWLLRKPWLRAGWTISAILVLAACNIVYMFGCDSNISNTFSLPLNSESLNCEYPVYFSYYGILVLIEVTVLVQLGFLAKILILVPLTVVYCVLYAIVLPNLFDRYDIALYGSYNTLATTVSTKYSIVGKAIAISLTLAFYIRHNEVVMRKLFIWKYEADEAKELIQKQREKNEALVYNILPAHVARDFIGTKKRDEELVSQAYDEAGVIFASCPNFNDFYTEDSVNNDGLECLRFLNEIISDYDELLNEARFKNIIKIKTIGSTYMAASGMNLGYSIPKDAPVKERWQHLADLTDFAYALKETLDRINSQSFNSFVLRIGINQGPIIGGVIGAKKPHFDIWGNTVNVSSRMESTGQAGKIQCVEDTMLILKEFGFTFEKRGFVKVKGKGELITYFLTGKDGKNGGSPLPNQPQDDIF